MKTFDFTAGVVRYYLKMTISQLIIVTCLLISIIRGPQVQYQIYMGFKIKEIANITRSALTKYFNINIEGQCLNLCMDEMCKALAFHKLSRICVIAKYGRIILEQDSGTCAWIKSM